MLKHKIILSLAVLSGLALGAQAQEKAPALQPADNPWYVGLGGGTSFGQCTFWSITEEGIRNWGLQGGIFGGYKFNRLISLEAGFQLGRQSQFNLDCCPYWLGTDGVWKATQVIDKDGWYFDDLEAATRWFKFAIQGNFNMLSFIENNKHWSLDLSPQISLVNTQTTWKGNLSKSKEYHEEAQPKNWHLGIGGQIGAGYAFNDLVKLGVYGGITALTGKRFDMIPNKVHDTNIIWDAGIKLTFSFGENKKKKAAIAAAAAEAERLAAEQAAREEAARLAALKAEQERLAAEKAALEEAERLAAEQAAREAAEKEEAFKTTLTVYFDNGKVQFADSYVPDLEHILGLLKKYPDFKLQIRGYASKSGSAAYNKMLSELRMEEVQYWFIGHQVAPERAQDVHSCGVDANAASEADGRRVEVNFVK